MKQQESHARILRLSMWLIVLLLYSSVTSAAPKDKKVSVDFKSVSAVIVLNAVQKQTDLSFVYSTELAASWPLVTISAKQKAAELVIDQLSALIGCTYEINDNVVSLSRLQKSGKERTVKGIVRDDSGQPLMGVPVSVGDTHVGTVTDGNGAYSLKISTDRTTLKFSYVGMDTQYVTVKSGTSDVTQHVMLRSGIQLEDVVVTGMFQRKKEGFTGSANKMEGDEIRKLTSGNILNAIQMLDPGFRMGDNIMSGANPNSVPDFNMRGQSSMGDYSTEETVIMRGDIDTRPNQPLFVLDGIIDVGVSKIIDLDPAQVESITLLKDAAAMAIYGSQASNGVVIVETKAPATGRLRVSYNGNYKVEYPDLTDYHLLNATQKLELERRAGYYDPIGSDQNIVNRLNAYRWKLLETERGVNTYWLSRSLHTVFVHRHGVNLEGGNETLRYKLYGGVNQAPGIMKETGIYGRNASLDIRYRNKGLLISNIVYVDYTISDRTSPYGTFSAYAQLNPYYRIYDANGQIQQYLERQIISDNYASSAGMTVGNPMYNAQFNSVDRNKEFVVRNAFRAEYLPMENLRLSVDFNLTKGNSDLDIFKPANHTDFLTVSDLYQRGSYNWSHSDTNSYELAFTANYNKVWKNRHVLSTFARYSVSESTYHNAGVYVTGFPNMNMDEVYLGAKTQNVSGNENKTRAFGGVATLSYTYDQRYAVDANVRFDASSQFGRNNRYAPFWSTGLRWNMDKEKFIKKWKLFDELVFRVTYGVTGTQGFSAYQALQMYSYASTMRIYQSSDVVGALLYGMGNPDLKWQKTNALNVGLDFNLFHRVLSGRLEYYNRQTNNTVLDYSLAPSVGFDSVKENLGNIANQGYEFTIRLMPYNNVAKQFNFSIVANGSHNKNEIKKISNALRIRNEQQLSDDASNPNKLSRPIPRYVEGYSQSMIWAVRSLGIDPITGREILLTQDGQRTSEWNAADMVPVGDTEPDLMGTLGLNLNWRGLSLNVAARYQFGGQYYNRTLVDKIENANLSYNVDIRAYTDRWLTPGDIVRYKAVTQAVNGSQTKATSRFVMDKNELVLNTISMQYRFEKRREQFISKLGLSAATLGLYFEDLFHWSTIKQERGIQYPMSRQISMMLNLTF